jgi:hypothetical protein
MFLFLFAFASLYHDDIDAMPDSPIALPSVFVIVTSVKEYDVH